MRAALEIAKQLSGSRSGRGRFTQTHPHQPPKRSGETERLGILWFPRAFPLLYGDNHCKKTDTMKRLAAGQNLTAGNCKRGAVTTSAIGSPHR